MSAFRTLRLPIALAVVATTGMVGMLVFDGLGDVVAFFLAALPLIVGAEAWRRGRRSG